MTKSRYLFTVADGSPVWSKGRASYEEFWEHVHDHLRFHRGAGFQVNDRKVERLEAVHDDLRQLLDNHDPGTSFTVASIRTSSTSAPSGSRSPTRRATSSSPTRATSPARPTCSASPTARG
jgi:hypothetical protein